MNAQWEGYKSDRDNGISHAQIVQDGVYTNVEELALRYSQMLAIQADYMNRQECDTERARGPLDVFGNTLKAGS